jgi:hypothetical protein
VPAWRRSRIDGGPAATTQPLPEYHPSHPASQAGADPAAAAPAPGTEAFAEPGGEPQIVSWTESPDFAGAEPLPEAELLPEVAAVPETPVVIEHEAFTDEKGVKTLVIKGNRQRDPYRETRLAQEYRALLAQEAEARAREEAALAQAQAAAEQAAYAQWLAEQAYLDEYAAQQYYQSGPQIYNDGTGFNLVEPTPEGWYVPEAYDPSAYYGGR